MWPLKLFSAALQLSLEIVFLEKNQQNHWNFRKIWPFMSLFFENAALGLIWVGRRCPRALRNSWTSPFLIHWWSPCNAKPYKSKFKKYRFTSKTTYVSINRFFKVITLPWLRLLLLVAKIIKWMGLFHMYSHNMWIHLKWKIFCLLNSKTTQWVINPKWITFCQMI